MEGTVLHRIVREHLETFRAEIAARGDGGGLPQFVEREFREFLTCGVLSRGFARVRCEGCAFGGAGRTPRGRRAPTCPRAPVGADPALPPALPPRLEPQALPRGARRPRPRRARLLS